jgi:hypothetical protein
MSAAAALHTGFCHLIGSIYIFNLLFFHNFHIFSLFNLIFFHTFLLYFPYLAAAASAAAALKFHPKTRYKQEQNETH